MPSNALFRSMAGAGLLILGGVYLTLQVDEPAALEEAPAEGQAETAQSPPVKRAQTPPSPEVAAPPSEPEATDEQHLSDHFARAREDYLRFELRGREPGAGTTPAEDDAALREDMAALREGLQELIALFEEQPEDHPERAIWREDIAQAHEHFAQQVEDSPLPLGLQDEQRAAYDRGLRSLAMRLRRSAEDWRSGEE